MIATLLVMTAGVYLALGVVFAPLFLSRGLGAVDPAAAASGKAFRLIITPGVIALWPVLMLRWKESHP